MFKLKKRSDEEGEWVGALRAVIGREHDEIVEFIRSGVAKPPPPIDPASLSGGATYTQAQLAHIAEMRRIHLWQSAMSRGSLDWLALTRSMRPDALTRFGQLMGASTNPTSAPAPERWLNLALQRPSGPTAQASFSQIEQAGSWLGYSPDDVVTYVFTRLGNPPRQPGFAAWVLSNLTRIADIVGPEVTAQPGHWSRVAWGGRDLVRQLRVELIGAATSSAKTVRAASRAGLALVEFSDVEHELKRVATDGEPASRAAAVDLMAELAPDDRHADVAAWLSEHCAQDRSTAVREAVARFAAVPATAKIVAQNELPDVDLNARLPGDFGQRFMQLIERTGRARPGGEESRARLTIAVLEGKPTGDDVRAVYDLPAAASVDSSIYNGLAPLHLARALLYGRRALGWSPQGAVEMVCSLGHPTPLELHVVANHDGLEPGAAHSVVTLLLGGAETDVWPRSEIERWVLHQLPALTRYLSTQTDTYGFSRPGLFKAFAKLPDRPDSLTRSLVECGLTGLKGDQPLARQLLGADARDLVVPALASGKVGERVGAATWLRELKDPTTEQSLRTAISREKQDNAKAQMMLSLEAIGASLDEYLAPDRLFAEAQAGLTKKGAVPGAIDWVRFELLPPVHWNDGTLVNSTIFQWFAASAVKAKSAEPSPLLRRYTESMRTDEARRFAEALFESWVSRDLAPRPREECERDARQAATWKIKWANQDPKGEAFPQYKGLTVDQGMQLELPRALEQPAGSATDSKGVLSLVAAMGGPELAPRVLAYVKKWRGHRLHQGKAMIQMLAWMEYPAAIQVVLTIAQRFRPKGLQDDAASQAELLADRRGWTVEDLADRTVPRGGFDDDGRLQLDYGDRSFTAHLRDDLTIELVSDATGKVIKSLPEPRQDEDGAEIKALQQDLAAARKEIKATAKLQPEHLFASMCVERSWDADDFVRYIVGHPVMRRLASRLTWIAETGDERRLFRPLSDGTLIDIDDDELALSDDASVFIAHDVHVDPDEASRWIDHFADYAVSPLFPQFDRPKPPTAAGNHIDEVKGHLINALALRGAITKYGWQLGEAQDAGMVLWVQKDFGSAGLVAVLDLMGTPAYADDSTTALVSMYFARRGGVGNPSRAVPLSDVPPILLQETYGEVLGIAAAGTGYDPDYEKKVTYG